MRPRRSCRGVAVCLFCSTLASVARADPTYNGCLWLNPATVCRDASNTGVLLSNHMATCEQLQPYCHYQGAGWAPTIQAACPVSCRVCPTSSNATGARQLLSVPAEWDDARQVAEAVNTTAALPQSNNLEGCSEHPTDAFLGKVALLHRGAKQCDFAEKVRHAEKAGAVAVLIYDSHGSTTLSLLRLPPGDQRPGIPAWLVSLQDGMDITDKIKAGEDCHVSCNWEHAKAQADQDARATSLSSGSPHPKSAAARTEGMK